MRYRIFPYQMFSESARALTNGLSERGHSALRVRRDGRYRYRLGDLIINWGNSAIPSWMNNDAVQHTLNKPTNVANASNKINCFRTLFSSEIPTVPFTTDRTVAQGWDRVYVRHVLNGHSGEGIEIVETNFNEHEDDEPLREIASTLVSLGYDNLSDAVLETANDLIEVMELPDAPLYTKAIDNNGEYRVHVFNGEVIDYRKKSRRVDDEMQDGQGDVRTLANGWVYRQSNLRRLERVENLAISAIEALGLDFGAVDIIMDNAGEVYVLEVNTACGMDDATLTNYLNALENYAVRNQ